MGTETATVTLFLSGDVMTGRGIDQALPWPCEPTLHEPWIRDARDYVALAEIANGPIERPLGVETPWGEALAELAALAPDARIVNLETSLTRADEPWPDKGIHYRMSPDNAETLRAAGLDVCVLANNHVVDWGRAGLEETLATLEALGIGHCGAGRDLAEAQRPAVVDLGVRGRVLVFGLGHPSSGIPSGWAAGQRRSGVAYLPELKDDAARAFGDLVARHRRPGDLVVASIHWGGNWGYEVPAEQQAFARRLVDEAGVDLVHGHSSHHPKGLEVYRDRLILYGTGDLLTDYEGIGGHERYRGELGLMVFPTLEARTGRLTRLRLTPTRLRRLRLERAEPRDAAWLAETLSTHSRPFGVSVALRDDGRLEAAWD